MNHTRTRRVLLVAALRTQILDVAGPFQIFTRAAELYRAQNSDPIPIYSLEVVTTARQTTLMTNCELQVGARWTFRQVRGEIDTLLVTGGDAAESDEPGLDVVRWIRKVAPQIRWVGSVCTGAMLLARTGMLDGRKATTHWKWCEVLAKKYPRIAVDPNPIFLRDGNIYTSAGITAGMDLSLALVEEDFGSRLALEVARDLVLYLRRKGGQSQFSAALAMQLSDSNPLRELESWVLDQFSRPEAWSSYLDMVSQTALPLAYSSFQEVGEPENCSRMRSF